VNFGPLIMEIQRCSHTHPNRLFRKTIFRPLWCAARWNFYTRYRTTKACQSSPHQGRWFPRQFFYNGVSKI